MNIDNVRALDRMYVKARYCIDKTTIVNSSCYIYRQLYMLYVYYTDECIECVRPKLSLTLCLLFKLSQM